MVELGYSLSSEEFAPDQLISFARQAETAGFTFSLISDHYHPWTNQQPHSSFVWSTIGGISQVVDKLRLGTGVTCPTMRVNPAIVAQAAATSAVLMRGRFFLGVGTGENLNEHILGDHWPKASERLEMLEEAILVMRQLWKGGWQSHSGKHYTVENARIFTLPKEPPAIMVAASKPGAARLAGRVGDGLISFEPKADLIKTFEAAGGKGNPRYGQLTVCYASSEEAATAVIKKYWPNAGIGDDLMTDLPLPSRFEQIVDLMDQKKITEGIPAGPDPQKHIAGIKEFVDAGFDHVYVHQVGPQQDEFFRFYSQEVIPQLSRSQVSSNGMGAEVLQEH
jgi:coenzyme F420-dependent glucose-6-phosphate dehydrogenase